MKRKKGLFEGLPMWQVVCEFSICGSEDTLCTVRLLPRLELPRASNETSLNSQAPSSSIF